MKTPWMLTAAAAMSAICAMAVETKTWTQSEAQEFEKGVLKGLALSSEGQLSLAPVWKEVFDPGLPHLWSAAADSKGNVYAGGADGVIIAVSPDGKGRKLATLEGGTVFALAVNSKDELFAAVSPEAKVYRIDSAGKASLFCALPAHYVWALVPAPGGVIYAATGDPGQIHKIAPDGKATLLFDPAELHVRSLALDAKGNLIAGTDPGGVVLRVSADGAGFVLYQTAKREVTAVAVSPDGVIYAAASGSRAPSAPAIPAQRSAPAVPAPAAAPAPQTQPGQQQVGARPPAQPAGSVSIPLPSDSAGAEIYRIGPDGEPRRIWSNAQLVLYSLAFNKDGKLLAATGNQGRIYRIDSDLANTRLIDADPQQVTALAAGPHGVVAAVTANPAKIYFMGPGLEKSGTIESDLLDANYFTYWGRLWIESDANGGSVSMAVHSGNADRTRDFWSPWRPVDAAKGSKIDAPPARYLGWRATLEAAPDGNSPVLRKVEASYQAKNLPPVVERIESTPANYKFPAPGASLTASSSITLPPIGQARRPASGPVISAEAGTVTLNYDKGYTGARWKASDPNGDTLQYKLEYRGIAETGWKPLAEKLKEARHSWDSTSFPDGRYVLRVTASDEEDNYPGQALTAQLVSESFLIDNTPPAIAPLTVKVEGGKLVIAFHASDAYSMLQSAEYSINGGPWVPAPPTTRITDWRELDYSVTADKPAGSEFTIAVRVTDERDNVAVAKAVVH